MQRKTVPIAGWLFADLLLGLAMLFITSMVGLSIPPPVATTTPTPTQTATPTATATAVPRTGTPGGQVVTPTPTPTPGFGLSSTRFHATFRIDPSLVPDLIARPTSANANQARAQLREQLRECFKRFDGASRAGIVLSFGGNPSAENGKQLAAIANTILKTEFPRVFSVTEDLHSISRDAIVNGTIEMWVYFMIGPGLADATALGSHTCSTPPTWCLGNGSTQINIFNWGEAGSLYFSLGGKTYEIGYAGGENPVFRCILVNPGMHQWQANYRDWSTQGTLEIRPGEAARSLFFCVQGGRLTPACTGALPPEQLRGK